MPRNRHPAILAIVPLLFAACGAQATEAPSASLGSPGPSALPTGPAGATPDPSCPILDEAYVGPVVEVTPQIGRVGLELGISEIAPTWNPTMAFTPPPGDVQSHPGVLPGGHDVPADLRLVYPDLQALGTAAILSVRPSIVAVGGPAVPLALSVIETRETSWLVNLRGVPDTDAPARLEVVVEWRDSCFTYTAEGSVDVNLVSTGVTSSCPLDREGFYSQLSEVEFAPPLLVGEADVDLIGMLPVARYLPEGPPGGDAPRPFEVWDRDLPAVTGAPATALTVSEANDRVELLTMDASYYGRGQVTRHLDSGRPASPTRVFHRSPDRRADGTFRLRLPPDAGRYVAWLQFDFESTCATGTAWAVFSVDVAAPEATPEPSPTEEPSPAP